MVVNALNRAAQVDMIPEANIRLHIIMDIVVCLVVIKLSGNGYLYCKQILIMYHFLNVFFLISMDINKS